MKVICFFVVVLFCTTVLSQVCDKQCKVDVYVGEKCRNNELGEILGKNLSGASNIQQVHNRLLKNAEEVNRDLKELHEFITSDEFTKDVVPKIVNTMKLKLKDCVDSSRMDFSDTICKVPSEKVRRDVIDVHKVPSYIATHLNSDFGSYMPKEAVATLLSKNAKYALTSLALRQKDMNYCMQNIDELTAGVANVLEL